MKLSDIPAILRENGINAMTVFPSGQVHFAERWGVFVCNSVHDFEKATDTEVQRRRMYTPGPEKTDQSGRTSAATGE